MFDGSLGNRVAHRNARVAMSFYRKALHFHRQRSHVNDLGRTVDICSGANFLGQHTALAYPPEASINSARTVSADTSQYGGRSWWDGLGPSSAVPARCVSVSRLLRASPRGSIRKACPSKRGRSCSRRAQQHTPPLAWGLLRRNGRIQRRITVVNQMTATLQVRFALEHIGVEG